MVAAARASPKKLPLQAGLAGLVIRHRTSTGGLFIVHEQNSVFHQSKDSKLAQSLEQDTGLE